MKRTLILASLALEACSTFGQARSPGSEREEIAALERAFSRALVSNDPVAIEQFLTDDWIVVDADGGVADRARFLGAIKSGALTHEAMESEDTRVRVYGSTAVATALTTTRGAYGGRAFTTNERATDVFVRQEGRWKCALSQLTRFTEPVPR